MTSENWHQERDRLVQLLHAIESGSVIDIGEADLRQLRATSAQDIALLKARLAQLNARLGDVR